MYAEGKFISRIEVPLFGRHNCLNVLAALTFFFHLGRDLQEVAQALKSFKGIKRRLQLKGNIEGVTFIDDYAHHPTEIAAAIEAVRLLGSRRLIVIFEPHRYSRISRLKDEFSGCFGGADIMIVTDIYGASEKEAFDISAQSLCFDIAKKFPKPIEYLPKTQIPKLLPSILKEGDIVLGLGAGDINRVIEEAVIEFKGSRVKT